MRTTTAWEAVGPGDLRRSQIARRELRPDDVAVRVDFCGVCHSDLHALDSWAAGSVAPLVPGHEFTGVVTEIGAQVRQIEVGDTVAVGNIVDACLACDMCAADQENYCREFPTLTYGGTDRRDGSSTLGAWAREYVVRENFAYPLPAQLDPAAAAPLMCAGVTVWEPLRALGVGPSSRIAVVGLGGLGHLAVKLAVALGADVTVVSRSEGKSEDAHRLGASNLLVSADGHAMAAARGRFDLILDTVAVAHDLAPYLELLALDGTLCQVGYLGSLSLETMSLLLGRKRVTSAGSGGRRGTAELLEFCAKHSVSADVELLPSARVHEALDRLARGDVRHRFVLDLSDLVQ